MKGFSLGVGPSFFYQGEAIDRNLIFVPEVLIDSQGADIPTALKPTFDAIWNAFGYERSFNYYEAGNWRHRK